MAVKVLETTFASDFEFAERVRLRPNSDQSSRLDELQKLQQLIRARVAEVGLNNYLEQAQKN